MSHEASDSLLKQVNQFQKPHRNTFWQVIIFLLPFLAAISEIVIFYPVYAQTLSPSVSQVVQLPSPASRKSHLSARQLPANGTVTKFWNSTFSEILAPLKIYTKGNLHHFVKVVDPKLNQSVLTVFIRAGQDVFVQVPIGTYEIRYATGTQWYGENDLFGKNTFYGKAQKSFVFKVNGNKVQGYSLYLYPKRGVPLPTKRINRNQFSTNNQQPTTNNQQPTTTPATDFEPGLKRIESKNYRGQLKILSKS